MMFDDTQVQAQEFAHFLHLVRVDDLEFYFFEFEDAVAKLHQEPDASYERITLH